MVFSQHGNEAVLDLGQLSTIDQLEEILKQYAEDISDYQIDRFPLKTWNTVLKDGNGGYYKEQMYSGKIELTRKVAKSIEFEPIQPVRYNLPTPRNTETTKTKSYKTALIVPDSQNSYYRDARTGYLDPVHDRRCWALVFHLCEALKPDNVVLLGDMLDLPDFSKKYLCTPEMRNTTQATLNEMGFILSRIRTLLPDCKFDYILGNHEKRLPNSIVDSMIAAYGLTRANDHFGLPVMSLPYLLGLDELNIGVTEPFPDGKVWLNKEFMCCHTTGYRSGYGATAKKFLDEGLYSVVQGHQHNLEFLSRTVFAADGRLVNRIAGSPGTIARLDGVVPAQKKENNWQQSLWLVHYEPDGYEFSVEILTINNGVMIYRGERTEADYPIEELREFAQCEFY